MKQPPRDDKGVLPHDHDEIANADCVIRYIPSVHLKRENGSLKISSAAFTPSTPPNDPRSTVSVDVEKLLLSSGSNLPYRARLGEGVARLSVGCIRSFAFKVGWDPLPENPEHGGIWGVGKSQSNRRKVSKECAVLVIAPSEPNDN